MDIELRPLEEQVVVVTGATSGIGLATARLAAKRGARVVLVSRDKADLKKAVRDIQKDGGEATYAVADVGDPGELRAAAEHAVREFGGIDTWINNAGVSIYGRIEEVPLHDARRLFETNYWGLVHGSLVAAEHLREHGGALINIGSVLSERAIPLQGHYSASKHAVKGFTDSLRMELEEEGTPISVTLIKPAGIATPFTEHAKNYTEHEPKLPPPVYKPEDVAGAILHAAEHPKRDIFVGSSSKVMSTMNSHAPRLLDRFSEKTMFKAQLREGPPLAQQDNLYQPGADGRVRGRHPGQMVRPSLYTKAVLHPKTTAALVTAGLAALAWMGRGSALRRS
jgi:short-subunit dehydrogenase